MKSTSVPEALPLIIPCELFGSVPTSKSLMRQDPLPGMPHHPTPTVLSN